MNDLRYYDLGYSEVFVFRNYLINQIREGITIVDHHADALNDMIDKHYKNRDLVYLSNRANSYSVNPMVYKKISEISNLIALGIVAYSPIMRNSAQFESQFCKKPFEVFPDFNEAILWATNLIK